MDLKKDIVTLELENKIINNLKKNNIIIIEDLWILKRNDLKSMGLSDSEINQILIKLQLLAIGLNEKIYDSDRLKI